MRLLVTGICGFVGSTLARSLLEWKQHLEIIGFDNLMRRGSESNIDVLESLGVKLIHGDLRCQSDVDSIPKFDWAIDAAANPSVLAGADGKTSSRQLMEHNLLGTINLLERCKEYRAGFTLLSTSRVYSIPKLASLRVEVRNHAFTPVAPMEHFSPHLGIQEGFSTTSPVSLYGVSKVASESIALEYGEIFDFPVWINRCGVMAGAGQFGKADQGIFSYWIRSYRNREQLKYIGFEGQGYQVRDCLHPRDLTPLLLKQMEAPKKLKLGNTWIMPRVINVSGGVESAISLRQLSDWCDARFGSHIITSDPNPRPFDLPWVVLDNTLAEKTWGWKPSTPREAILEEIASQIT